MWTPALPGPELGYAVQTAVNAGLELLIFVLRAAHSHDFVAGPSNDSGLWIPDAAALRHLRGVNGIPR